MAGGAGGATNLANIGTANGGGGGNLAQPMGSRGNPGASGNAPGSNFTATYGTLGYDLILGSNPTRGAGGPNMGEGVSMTAGNPGAIVVFEANV
jgi:hypothetical protein